MNEHDDPERDHPTEPAPDPEVLRALQALLRDELVDVDPDRREQAILAALGAADATIEGSATQPAPLASQSGPGGRGGEQEELAVARRARRQRQAGRAPALVAAATVAVLAVGALIAGLGSGGGQDSSASGVAEERSEALLDSGSADDGAGGGADQGGEAEMPAAAPPTTVTATSGAAADLGDFPDSEQLLDTVAGPRTSSGFEQGAGPAADEDAGREQADQQACGALSAAEGWTVLGTARVDDREVVVVAGDVGSSATLAVLDAGTCEVLDQR